jgi:hypothetical protein
MVLPRNVAKILYFLLLVVFFLKIPATNASEYLCDALQKSNFEVAKLDDACPVGPAVWNDSDIVDQELYWIQCGYYSKPHIMPVAKELNLNASQYVWLKAEEKGYRCLIGPYSDHQQLRFDLIHLKLNSKYSDLFVRIIN